MHEHTSFQHIETERLLLRSWRDSDREPWAAMNADRHVRAFFPGTLSREESDAQQDWLNAHIAQHGFGFWALEARASGAFLGFTGLLRTTFPAPFTPCVEIGWRLARHAWGKGYASEAALASLDYGFGALALPEILSFAVTGNIRSRRVMERIGMRRVPGGDFEHPNVPTGNPLRPHVLYRITAAEHAERRPPGADVYRSRPSEEQVDIHRPRPSKEQADVYPPRPSDEQADVHRPRPSQEQADVHRPRPSKEQADVYPPRPSEEQADVHRPRPSKEQADVHRSRPSKEQADVHGPRPENPRSVEESSS